MVLPCMFDQRFDVSADGIDARAPRAEETAVSAVDAVAVALHHIAIRDAETTFSVAVRVVFVDLPRFTGRQLQRAFAVGTVRRRLPRDA